VFKAKRTSNKLMALDVLEATFPAAGGGSGKVGVCPAARDYGKDDSVARAACQLAACWWLLRVCI
jgi:hypothetical protein